MDEAPSGVLCQSSQQVGYEVLLHDIVVFLNDSRMAKRLWAG
jgi:hypothetical protein